ncbi:two-component system, chemotaxis family, CheB/CheR fusion protein [Methylocapsa palsarum]|uniref:histidine kinase n=2 Tax=Methylocapsa palsarum TaxID=1612308 RepID=A0A1I4D6T0_9HYPH|nr:two-component system, chemotaxis family, CheB/CheR fusion protein [Methylocapsa palsarum]
MGIPADQRAEIFEAFRQLNNPARDSGLGLGIGRAIVSRLARLIGAEVQVSSRLGHGSRFSLLLPLDRTTVADIAAKSAPDDSGGRILLIEDNAIVRQGYELLLILWGYEILAVATGEESA